MSADDDESWSWRLSPTAQDDLDALEREDRDRLLEKLDEICDSPWRTPPDYGEPLQNSPYRKVRIGGFRLSVSFIREHNEMLIVRVQRRGGAYTADDD